jgi:L-threonylcarbamoyladenylate synthase
VALRLPADPLARRVLEAAGVPVAAPSANPAGRISPTTADHVLEALDGRIDLVVDGGRVPVGVESTVLDLAGDRPVLLRPGGLERAAIEAVLGAPLEAPASAKADRPLRSPGQLSSHYAPRHPVRLDAASAAPDEALLAFGPLVPTGAAVTLNLSERGDLGEAAANLFFMLHALDRAPVRAIAAMPIPKTGLGEAIRDRLMRAAAPG